MSIASSYVCSFLILYACMVAEGSDVCGSIKLEGPLDKNGNPPYRGALPTLEANRTDPIVISCRIFLPADQNRQDIRLQGINPRLNFYLTTDGKVCTTLSQNNSHTDLGSECEGFNYTYYELKDAKSINFTYHMIPIARMDNSIIACGARYVNNGTTDCFTHTAAMISFQKDPRTCSPSTTTTNEITTTTDPPTTTEPPTTTKSTTTEPPTTTKSTTTTEPSYTTKNKTLPPTIGTLILNTDHNIGVPLRETFIPIVTVLIALVIVLVLIIIIQMMVILKRKTRDVHIPSPESDSTSSEGSHFENSMTKVQ